MIPYFPQPVWRFGPLTIHAFGVMVAIALVSGYWVITRQARRRGTNADHAAALYAFTAAAGVVSGFLWARVFGANGISFTGMELGAILVLAICLAPNPAKFWSGADNFAYAFPFVLAIARSGCFFAHDHLGRFTTHWIGVRFPGGTRFDLGLLYALSAYAIAGLVVWINGRSYAPGILTATTIGLVAFSRLGILMLADSRFSDRAVAVGEVALAIVIAIAAVSAHGCRPAGERALNEAGTHSALGPKLSGT